MKCNMKRPTLMFEFEAQFERNRGEQKEKDFQILKRKFEAKLPNAL